MTETNTARYNGVAMALHWVTALIMIVLIFFGEDLMEAEREGGDFAAASTFLPSLHVSLGTAVLVLTILRIVWRAITPVPPYPATMKPWEIMISKTTHGLFYLLMIGLPISGWLAFADFVQEKPAMAAVQVFGLFPVPAAPLIGEFVKDIHALGSNAAMALLILHVLAALKHQFIDRDAILQRMSPR